MTDPQTAADAAARRLRGWLDSRMVRDPHGRDLRKVLDGYARMAAELEQVRGECEASRDAAERANNLLMLLVFREGGSIQLSQADLVRASESLNFWINSRAALLADLARLEADAERSDAEGAGKGPESHAEAPGCDARPPA